MTHSAKNARYHMQDATKFPRIADRDSLRVYPWCAATIALAACAIGWLAAVAVFY